MKLFEHILGKQKIINKFNISDYEKQQIIDFFKTHANLESEIDWNNDNEEELLNEIYMLQKRTNDSRKNKTRRTKLRPEDAFKQDNFYILKTNENGQYIGLLNHDAAVYANSAASGGGPAKWCIGTTSNHSWWDDRVSRGYRYVLYLYKPDNESIMKFMIELEPVEEDESQLGSVTVWNTGNHIEIQINSEEGDYDCGEVCDFCELEEEDLYNFWDTLNEQNIEYEDRDEYPPEPEYMA
jgi:hypothetical protein